jgi:hypothetical protein
MASESPAGAAVDALERLACRLPRRKRSALRFNLSVLVGQMVRQADDYRLLQLQNIALLEELNETARARNRTRQLMRHGVHGGDQPWTS